MGSTRVSVVIPAYNQAEFLTETVESVLAQTHPEFEVIVVNDASTDGTAGVMERFTDPRVRYIAHENNRGLPATRNTGILAAKGDLVAFLDADDLFHPEKLAAHVASFDARPDLGASYNSRFELNHSARTIREIWRPPAAVSLGDLVLGFPFAPSDMVVRREWLSRAGLFNPRMGSAEDTDLPCRLALDGCRFEGVDRVLNSRRYHSGRGRKNLRGRRDDVARALDAVFADPRCPEDVRAIKATAMSHHLMVLVSLALLQRETALAHEFIEELRHADPAVLHGKPCDLVSFLMMESVADESADHERLLHAMFAQLPPSLSGLSGQSGWAVARGYLWKGLRAVLWGRTELGTAWIDQAARRGAAVDDAFLQFLTSHLLNYEHEYGPEGALDALARLATSLRQVGGRRWAGRLSGSYMVNRAFERYHRGQTAGVPGLVVRALAHDPSYLANRGVLAMLARSLVA